LRKLTELSDLLRHIYEFIEVRLKGKVALITGATSGIGKQIAQIFSQEGAKVGAASRKREKAITVAKEINEAEGEAFRIEMNVSDENQVETGVRSLVSRFGYIDILVANVGIHHISSVDSLDYSDWKKVIDVNLRGAFLTNRACLKEMLVSGGTVIYWLCSLSGSVSTQSSLCCS
jgi:3-hydroxybutyrate dehydrogenase